MEKLEVIIEFENAFGELMVLSSPIKGYVPVRVLSDSVRLPRDICAFDCWHKSMSGRWVFPNEIKEFFSKLGVYHNDGIYNTEKQGPIARGQIYAVDERWLNNTRQ